MILFKVLPKIFTVFKTILDGVMINMKRVAWNLEIVLC